MTATVIHVDWKQRKKLYTETLSEPTPQQMGIDVARNKQLVNDLKQLLDDHIDQLDLRACILLVPNEQADVYIKADGTDINQCDLKNIGRILHKVKEHYAQP